MKTLQGSMLQSLRAVQADIDGRSMGRIGQESQVLGRVSLDPQSLTDRFNGH